MILLFYTNTLLTHSAINILPVNAHAEVNLLNLNYITALYFILLPLYCQIICTTINNRNQLVEASLSYSLQTEFQDGGHLVFSYGSTFKSNLA